MAFLLSRAGASTWPTVAVELSAATRICPVLFERDM